MQSTTYPNPPAASASPFVERWPTEIPLFVLSILASIPIWLFLVFSVIGIVYALAIGAFLFVVHLGLVARVRGSGVRLSQEQFPELHQRVQRLAQEMGIADLPDVYLIQSGGTLNAFATKFLGANLVVLYTELLDACGSDTAARDMIIAHELGHIHAGHLRWRWLTAPAHMIPFLGPALSRAREYTCDRYGHRGAGDHDGALRGLTLLAAGPIGSRSMNRVAFARQGVDLQTGWMTIGEWFASHPPLAKRVTALDPSLAALVPSSGRGPARALAILGCVAILPIVAAGVVVSQFPAWLRRQAAAVPSSSAASVRGTEPASSPADSDAVDGNGRAPERPVVDPAKARPQVAQDLQLLAALLESERRAGHPIPWDARRLQRLWSQKRGETPYPEDPYGTDGDLYGYDQSGGEYLLWSVGPDGESDTDDDIVFDSRTTAPAAGRRPSGTRH